MFEGIERRLRQTLYPLLTVVNDKKFLAKLKSFICEFQQQSRADRGLSWIAESLQTLIELTCTDSVITVGQFANKLNETKGENERKNFC